MKKHFLMGLMFLSVFLFSVMAVTGTDLVNETKVINKDQMYSSGFSLSAQTTITVSINVTSGGPVDLLLMNSGNYTTYENAFTSGNSGTFYYIVDGSSLSVKAKTYSVTLGKGDYYVVIENADFTSGGASSTGSVTAAILISYDSSSASPGFELPIFLFAITAIISIRIYKKKN